MVVDKTDEVAEECEARGGDIRKIFWNFNRAHLKRKQITFYEPP